ncbi:MAG: hypothetical protein QG612_423 [Pseudomonadota bacterium]|nr:hypothetical protein [Pseudomonadota bacterium]
MSAAMSFSAGTQGASMAEYYAKSSRGRQVLRDRLYPLPRSARNLLLILDPSRPVRHWVNMVRGAGWAELGVLEQAGLIVPVTEPGPADTAPAPLASDFHTTFPSDFHADLQTVAPLPAGVPLFVRPAQGRAPARVDPVPVAAPCRPGAIWPTAAGRASAASCSPQRSCLGYADLYDSLNALTRQTLGLLRGYRYTLRIEKAQGLDDLERVAEDFVLEVERLRGLAAARTVARALGLGEPEG